MLKDPPPWTPFIPSGLLGAAGTVLTSTGTASAPKWGAGGSTFSASISANVPTGPTDNYSPAGYTAGVTNRLLLTAAAGGSTLDGLANPGIDGFSVLIYNPSTTDIITLANQASSIANNQFNTPNPFISAPWPAFVIGPQGGQILTWVSGIGWVFAS